MNYVGNLALALFVTQVLAGCASTQRPQGAGAESIDIQASYHQHDTDAPTLPRAYTGDNGRGNKYTVGDVAAIRALGVSITEAAGAPNSYVCNLINIKPGSPRLILIHEVTHAGQADGGHTDWWLNEAGGMIAETAYLMTACGRSDYELANLSWNNSRTPVWVWAWIRAHGPVFNGTVSDVQTAYAWGKQTNLKGIF